MANFNGQILSSQKFHYPHLNHTDSAEKGKGELLAACLNSGAICFRFFKENKYS